MTLKQFEALVLAYGGWRDVEGMHGALGHRLAFRDARAAAKVHLKMILAAYKEKKVSR